jgi:hypothetical protein
VRDSSTRPFTLSDPGGIQRRRTFLQRPAVGVRIAGRRPAVAGRLPRPAIGRRGLLFAVEDPGLLVLGLLLLTHTELPIESMIVP